MPMQMGFRWYGEGNDNIKLSDIKQIPGVTSIVWALHHKMPGEIWEEAEIAEVKRQLDEYGFCIISLGFEEELTCPYCLGTMIADSKNGLHRCLECGNEF